MKKILLTGAAMTLLLAATNAQVVVDTVSVGASYVNQNYYQLSSGTKSSVVKNNWDIAFQSSGSMGYAISINGYSGVSLYTYPHANINGWAGAFDTAGLSTWTPMMGDETTWDLGAFNQNADASNQFDLGWGNYDMTTHFVTGDSLFVIKLTDGSFRKLWIKNLANGVYNFVYANLDGTNEQTASLTKANYATKNFGYYSLVNNAAVDHEPVVNTDWDLVFTQYTANLGMPYTVTGVLSNQNVVTAKVENVADVTTFNDYATQTYSSNINTIGYNWKTYNMSTNAYVVTDSTVFFVQAVDSAIWKVVMTGFGGSANGNIIFSKEKLKSAPVPVDTTTGISHVAASASLSVSPNPVVAGNNLNVVVSLMEANATVNLVVYDITGKVVFQSKVNNQSGLKAMAIPTGSFGKGLYMVALDVNGRKAVQKVSIQ